MVDLKCLLFIIEKLEAKRQASQDRMKAKTEANRDRLEGKIEANQDRKENQGGHHKCQPRKDGDCDNLHLSRV
jgi:hypothetical protein